MSKQVKCDNCGTITTPSYLESAFSTWWTVRCGEGWSEQHYCSRECIAEWASTPSAVTQDV